MKKQINDLLLKMQSGENCIGETSDKLWNLYRYNILFQISVTTPYKGEDITDFMEITGFDIEKVEMLLNKFNKYGITNLKDVNTLAKIGYFNELKTDK